MIDPRKAALIIIDMQHGFLDSSSALCVAGAAATVPACTRALNRARELGMPVFHAIREYAADGSDVEAARHRGWVEGGKPVSRACASPRTLDEYEPLAPQPGDRVIAKPRFSAPPLVCSCAPSNWLSSSVFTSGMGSTCLSRPITSR